MASSDVGIEMSAPDSSRMSAHFLGQFNRQRDEVETCIDTIESATREIRTLKEACITTFTSEGQKDVSKKLQMEVKRASAAAARGKTLLDTLRRNGEAEVRESPRGERVGAYRSVYTALVKRYVDAVRAHQAAKEGMREAEVDTLVRRGRIALGDDAGLTDEELRARAAADPEHFLRGAIAQEASAEAQDAYMDAQARARDIQMLVRSIAEVSQMMQDIASLVQHQGELLDAVEMNVESAQVHVVKGNMELWSAARKQRAKRKWACVACCAGLILVLLLIAGLGIGLRVGLKSL